MPQYLRAGLLLLLCTLQVTALAASSAPKDKLSQVMELYGLSEIIKDLPQDVLDDFSQGDYLDRQQLSQEQADTIKQVVTTNFTQDRIRKDVLAHLRRDGDAARIDAVIARLSTPLYRKITALEQQANSPQAASDFQKYVARLALHSPDPQRLELMRSLDRASHSTRIAVSIEVEIAKTLLRCAAAFNPDDTPLTDARLRGIIDRLKGRITRSVRNHIIIWSLYAYRSLSTRQLEQYRSLYQDRDIQWFTRISSRALVAAMERASVGSARDIARLRNALHI